MPVQKSQLELQSLLSDISSGELRLPEIQREYVWKPTQVASLVESLYRGYPTGSLLLWKTVEAPEERRPDIGERQGRSAVRPLYLLDGQQRLTSLHRALRRDDHLDPDKYIEIVFNVVTEEFQNESASTRKDRRWVRVADVTAPDAALFDIAEACHEALPDLERRSLFNTLNKLHQIRGHAFHIETLTDFDYETVAQIFVRVNSGGRALKITDLALATLSARWPGVVAKFEKETTHWVAKGYPDLDGSFLTRLLASAVLQRGLSQWSHARLIRATDEQLDESWALVRRGLERLVPILSDIGIEHSSLIPSLNALVPLVMMLGSRADDRLGAEERDAVIYCFLISTLTNRYGGSADSILSRDIPAALDPERPVQKLLSNVGYGDRHLVVGADDLRGRTVTSPYFMLSYLVAHRRGATDWWDRNRLRMAGAGTRLEYHHIHPQATLKETYQRGQINELSNLAFISERANRRISNRSPADYFNELGADELSGHLVPRDPKIERAEGYLKFLDRRRALLAEAMTALLDQYAPPWLASSPGETDKLTGDTVTLQWHDDAVSAPKLAISVTTRAGTWSDVLDGAEVVACVEAAEANLSSDLTVAGTSVPFTIGEEGVSVELGPVRLIGTLEEWQHMLDREHRDVTDRPAPPEARYAWTGPVVPFPIMDTE